MPQVKGKQNENCNKKDIKLPNKYLGTLDCDVLYHLAMDTCNFNLKEMFGDVKFVCMGGTAHRMETFANYIMKEIGYEIPVGTQLLDLAAKSHRFVLYKVGPVISVNHGMGMPSMSILLHEMIKLVNYAGCQNPTFIRIGTCGGVGVEPGSVIVSNKAFNGLLEEFHEFEILGKRIKRQAIFDQNLAKEMSECGQPNDGFKTILGGTMAANDFYEGQGRCDGAICEHTEEEKLEFLKKLYSIGVRNIEMEATAFAAITNYTGIKSVDVCVSFLDRLKGDQVTPPKETLSEWQLRPQLIVGRYIKKTLNNM